MGTCKSAQWIHRLRVRGSLPPSVVDQEFSIFLVQRFHASNLCVIFSEFWLHKCCDPLLSISSTVSSDEKLTAQRHKSAWLFAPCPHTPPTTRHTPQNSRFVSGSSHATIMSYANPPASFAVRTGERLYAPLTLEPGLVRPLQLSTARRRLCISGKIPIALMHSEPSAALQTVAVSIR
jgi:hypothetical protein